MKRFLIKTLLFFTPFYVVIGLYFLIDPFKVLYDYPEPVNTDKTYQITGNRDFQSTELLLKNRRNLDTDYNSFILGNSRSFFYQTTTWNKYINGQCFHFNASNETLWGISRKLTFLDKAGVDLKNVLIVTDYSSLSKTQNSQGHLFIKHPATSGESWFDFHLEMFNGFCSKAMFAYIDLYFTGTYKPYMNNAGIGKNIWKHDLVTNQLNYNDLSEQHLKGNSEAYYADKMNVFYKRDSIQQYSPRAIFTQQELLLKNIQIILKAHHTRYKIIISPLYDQVKINTGDLSYLKQLFGAENVYDFSGINGFTNDYHNYYEASHYRPFVCDSILSIIYK